MKKIWKFITRPLLSLKRIVIFLVRGNSNERNETDKGKALLKRAIADRPAYLAAFIANFREAQKEQDNILMAHWLHRLCTEFEFDEIPNDIKPFLENSYGKGGKI